MFAKVVVADVSLLNKICDVAPESSTGGMLVVSVSSTKMGEVKSLVPGNPVGNSGDVVYLSESLMDIPLEVITSVVMSSVGTRKDGALVSSTDTSCVQLEIASELVLWIEAISECGELTNESVSVQDSVTDVASP